MQIIELEPYITEYRETGIITIPNFVPPELLENIHYELENYNWWVYAVRPYIDSSETAYLSPEQLSDDICKESISNLESNRFCYRFRRSYGIHYESCNCISCKLEEFAKSAVVTNAICEIAGCSQIIPAEIFISNYGKDDFLSIHHDIGKGDISATFSLTADWNPAWGGVLHFCDLSNNIYRSICPKYGSLNLFRLDETAGLDHFVSAVVVNRNRYTITAWYNVLPIT